MISLGNGNTLRMSTCNFDETLDKVHGSCSITGANTNDHVAHGLAILKHELMRLGKFVEFESSSQTGSYCFLFNQCVECLALFSVGKVRTLKSLLPHPLVSDIERAPVTTGAATYHHHASGCANEI